MQTAIFQLILCLKKNASIMIANKGMAATSIDALEAVVYCRALFSKRK